MGLPVGLDTSVRPLVADVVVGELEPEAACFRAGFWRLGLPIATKLLQPFIAEATEEHIVRCGLIGMQLEAGALKPLRQIALPGIAIGFVRSIGNRIAKDR